MRDEEPFAKLSLKAQYVAALISVVRSIANELKSPAIMI